MSRRANPAGKNATPAPLQQTLEETFGHDSLRPGQQAVIRAVLARQDTLAVMATGAGKSLCYQLPALHLPGTTLIISPLIALMKDQAEKLQGYDLAAQVLNSSLSAGEEAQVLAQLAAGELEFIFTTPERLTSAAFIEVVQQVKIDFVVIDEAHCISQWGHDFRPAFLGIADALALLGNPPVLALTATATDEVIADIQQQLRRPRMQVINTSIYRANLQLQVRHVTSVDEKNRQLLADLQQAHGSSIVYTATVKDADAVHAWLTGQGIAAQRYHGKLGKAARNQAQEAFMNGDARVMVATNAFGMGIDKADIRRVIHYAFPAPVEAYYQEAGRAGRDGEPAQCLLLYDLADQKTQAFFLLGRYPSAADITRVNRALIECGADTDAVALATVRAACKRMGKARFEVIVAALRADGLLEQLGDEVRMLPVADRASRLAAVAAGFMAASEQDREKLAQMMHYAQNAQCRWHFLLAYFGEPAPFEVCGHCDNCLAAQQAPV